MMRFALTNKLANRFAIATALVSSVSLLAIERANAACTPTTSVAAPANNANVVCTGTTTNQNTAGANTFGYGTETETGITITVENGASVTVSQSPPGNAGIGIHDGTINNFGTITTDGGSGQGIFASADVTVVNSGTINTPGNGAHGILTNGAANVNNAATGVIFGNNSAIGADIATVANSGTIEAGAGGEHTAISVSEAATVSNAAGGIIRDNAGNGIAIKVTGANGTINVTGNSGTIEANGDHGIAINAIGNANITNSGTIQALGTSGIAIEALTVTVANAATGTITGDAFAIQGSTVNVTGNSGTIQARNRAIDAATATVTNSVGGLISGNVAIGAGSVTLINSGTVESVDKTAFAVNAGITATVSNLQGGLITGTGVGITAATFDITNAAGATISGGGNAIEGSGTVRNAGTITGGTASVAFNGTTGINTLILQTGSVLNGDASGSTQGASNALVLQGHGTASNNFINFDTLVVQADSAWVWDTTATITGGTTISSGALAVDGVLSSPTTVNSGGALAGHGTVNGNVTVASGGAIAPGAAASFSTLSVNGNVLFNPGSIYRVNINGAGQNDKLSLTHGGVATLTGGTVDVVVQNGFAIGTSYNILTADGGFGGTTFDPTVTTNSVFLSPTLTYDANDVFLTLASKSFGTAAQTANQMAVAGALDASPLSNELVSKMLLQTTTDGARQAFDALSGEVFGTVQNTQGAEASFTRNAMLGRLRQASYANVGGALGILGYAGPQLAYAAGTPAGVSARAAKANAAAFPMRAPARSASRDLVFWTQGIGGWGHADSDGNAASLRSRFGGFLSGADMRLGEAWRAGLVAGYLRSDLNVDDRQSSAGIDSVQFGLYAGGQLGAFNLRTGASLSYDSIDISRAVVFPGFSDATSAHLHGSVGQVFGELGYGMTLGAFALEPFAGLAYVRLHDGSFSESGGLAALSGASVNEDLGYSSLGLRVATAVPLSNGTVLVPRGSLQWQYAFGDVTPTSALTLQSTGAAFTVAGLPVARNSALVESGVDWRFSPQAKLGVFYQGELAAHAQSHAVKGAFNWNF